jgi:Ca2+/Na+ antiporter
MFIITFFTINYSDSISEGVESPNVKILKTFIVYSFFIMFTKMNLIPTIFVFLILFIIYLLNTYKQYYDYKYSEKNRPSLQEIKDYNEKDDDIFERQKSLMILAGITILVGFLSYILEKKNEYGFNFDWKKFFIGTEVCDKLM